MNKKLFILMVMLMSGWSMCFAQDPTVSAPKPTINADQVKSAFCDDYEAFTKWDRGHGATMETIQINGTDNVLKFEGDYCAINIGERNVADMEYLHADVYSPTANGISQIRFGFSAWSGGEKYADAYNTDTPTGQWTSIDIPLTAFNGYDFAHMQVMRITMTKTNGNIFYMDNVYFYTKTVAESTVPTVAAPKPTVAASKVRSMFSDVYTPYYNFDMYNHSGIQKSVKTIGDGETVLELKGFRWAHFALGEVAGTSTVDLTAVQDGYLHFDVYVPVNPVTTSVQPGMFKVSTKKEAFSGKQELTGGQWKSVNLKVKDFQAVGLSAVNNLTFKDPANKTGIIYLDNVYFYMDSDIPSDDPTPDPDPDPDPDPTPSSGLKSAPTPTNAAADVKSVYSDAYAPFCTFTNAGGNNGIAEEEIAITETDKAMKLTGYTWVKYNIGTVDISDMEYLHVDVYTPTDAACATIQPILVNGNTSQYTLSPTLTAGKWTSINVKIVDYTAKGLDAKAVNEIRFKHSGTGTIILDNIYFSKTAGADGTSDGGSESGGDTPGGGDTPSIDIPLAPTPTHVASDVKAFFSDEYTLFGKFEPTTYSEATVEVIDHDATHKVCRMTNLNWCAVNLGKRDVSDKGYVHIDLYTPSSDAVTSFNIGFQLWSAPVSFEISGEDFNYRPLEPNKWMSFDIPLSAFVGQDFKEGMAGFRIRKSGKGTLYLDNLYFWGAPEGGGDVNPDEFPPIQDKTDGVLPPMTEPMLGVNLSSASGGKVPGTFGTDYMYPRMEDLYYFKAKGVKLIRFPFRAARVVEDLNNIKVDADAAKSDIAAMKAVVAEAERLGMWIFLDAHDYAERTINDVQYKLGEGEYTIEKFGKMWGAIANEFKDYTNIWGYDLQNEPKVTAQVLVEAYQAAINEIRKVDQNAQIIVEGTNWASAYEWIYGDRSDKQYPEYSTEVAWSYKANSPWLLKNLVDPQDKIVFQAHGYFDQDNSGTYQKAYSDVDWRKRFKPFLEWCKTNNKRALFGEFGVPYNGHSTGDERYMTVLDEALQFFREYQINATYWCAGAMYEANSLSCQPDKNALYGNYAKEKSTMKVLEKYFTNWANGSETGISTVKTGNDITSGITYNMQGLQVDSNYRGIVIKNGRKYMQK